MAVKGKTKSGNSERRIARFFTKWLTGQDKELYFWRSPSSGAVAKINLGNKSLSGDLIALKPEASFFTDIFSVEIKDGYGDTDFYQLLKGNKNFNIEDFWHQCVDDAYSHEKLPMLLFRRKNGIYTASFEEKAYKLIRSVGIDLPCISLIWASRNKLPNLYMFSKKELFEQLKPGDIKNAKI